MLKTNNVITLQMIEESLEIQKWLQQFSPGDVNTAKSLLCHLKFVTRDQYSNWLLSKLNGFAGNKYAVYAVRKFEKGVTTLWSDNGQVRDRPAKALGSEDFVGSLIEDASRRKEEIFVSHPSLSVLRSEKIRDILLVDDSIGSGKRVSDFIQLMTNCRTFNSWWSYGFIRIHVLSYARTIESEKRILSSLSGSDHGKRKYRISEKIRFHGDSVYDSHNLQKRWGKSFGLILDLCGSLKKIRKDRRKGFGNVMASLIFYHSVPNNIPGMLYCDTKGWIPLFPDRCVPTWMINMLEHKSRKAQSIKHARKYKLTVNDEERQVLFNIKKGIRTKASMARRLDCDLDIVSHLLEKLVNFDLITADYRLTKAGYGFCFDLDAKNKIVPDYSLYVPKTWCTD